VDFNHVRERARLRVPVPQLVTKSRAGTAPGGWSAPCGDPAKEIEALAALLAEVVELAGNRAVFPGDWELIAELAMGHESVRRAVRAGGSAS
jgi:hypothetical protein